jgi:DNA helicase-2/ATP-dependent DNA helicase PcrA
MLPVNVRGMWIGTFHGLCNRFLRAHWKLAGLPQGFQILDTADQLSAVKRVIKAMNLDEERFVPKQVSSWFIAAARKTASARKDVEARDEQTRKMVEIYQAYEDQCQREGVVDFAELMLRTYELMRDNDRAARALPAALCATSWSTSSRTPTAAVRLAEDVRGRPAPRQGVFAVGDDDQSIYAFRGAQVGNMADFEREYRVQQVIKLEQNYRSFGNILDAPTT